MSVKPGSTGNRKSLDSPETTRENVMGLPMSKIKAGLIEKKLVSLRKGAYIPPSKKEGALGTNRMLQKEYKEGPEFNSWVGNRGLTETHINGNKRT